MFLSCKIFFKAVFGWAWVSSFLIEFHLCRREQKKYCLTLPGPSPRAVLSRWEEEASCLEGLPFQAPVNARSRPDPGGLPGTGQVATGQYPQAPGHPSRAVAGAGDHPRGQNAEGSPGSQGTGPEGSSTVTGTTLNADASEPGQIVLSTSPAGAATDVLGTHGPQTQRPCGGWCCILLGLGQRSKGGLCLNLTSRHSQQPLRVQAPEGLQEAPRASVCFREQ